ncbi:MAG: aminopeptidase, partial [Moorea sp. SIO4A3]|nr:aminopeptidase [Moorena sp. SIO4A3]
GKDDAAYYLLNEARSYISEDSSRYRRPMVTNVYREAIELYDRHLYEKGACVYHMIWAELGEDLFWKAIQTFVQDNAHKTVETIDLLRAIEKATGRNLLFLFDQYVFRGGHPEYKVAYSWDGDSQLAKLTVTQTQAKDSNTGSDSELFDLKIPIAFGYTKLEDDSPVKTSNETCLQTFTVRVHQREQSFYFPLEKKPNLISFDHGNNYLKTVSLEYPIAELKAQLKFDPDPISRIYAGKALAKKGGLEAVKALSDALKSDSFWGVRLEIAKQLAKVKLDQAEAALIVGLSDSNPRVRRAVVQALGEVKTPESYNALKQLLEKGDASYYVEALAARSLGGMVSASLKDREDEVIQLLKKVLQERSGWNEVVRGGVIAGLSQIKSSPIALDVILEYTTPGIPQPLRLAAIRALGDISKGQSPNKIESILEQLEEMSRETFYLTQVTIVRALGKMETPKAMDILRSLLEHTPDGRIRRIAEEAIQKVQKTIGSDKAIKQLREELNKLKKDNQELKSRLENLEAKSN